MLRTLQIENYALIRTLKIHFENGFTVITGETGAGKSILMGALSLILGNRADTSVLYDKNRKCVVEGTFDIYSLPLHAFFEEHDLDYRDNTLIRREINEQGKSRSFINDTPVTLAVLKMLADRLIDIHSQHQSLLLKDTDFRLELIDQYAHNQTLLAEYRKKLQQYDRKERDYLQLKSLCEREKEEQTYNVLTVQELENARLSPSDQEDTEQAVRILSHAESIKRHLYQAAQRLSEQENNTLLQQLKAIEADCTTLNEVSRDYQNISDRLSAVEIELRDIAYDIVRKEAAIEVNPKELERQNERLNLLYTLQQKYRVNSVRELIDLKDRLKATLNNYMDHREQLVQVEKERTQLFDNVRKAAQALSDSREVAIPPLQKEMNLRLAGLGMPDGRFEIHLHKTQDFRLNGTDSTEFLFSANRGIAPAELSKMASGGEMSRLMLSIKSVITDSVLLPTVIFDEIDTGISGDTANRVADVMQEMARHHQLIVITHLPQIAVRANDHYLVYKDHDAQAAMTKLRLLSPNEREEAVAVMLGGYPIGRTALAAAREMLKQNMP